MYRMKAKLNEFIEHTFNREGSLYLTSNAKRAFSLLYIRKLSFAYMFLFLHKLNVSNESKT